MPSGAFTDPFLARAYSEKSEDYYTCERPEMLTLVPSCSKRILDVGCGRGNFSAALKAELNVEAWGVEPEPSAADEAKRKLDRVVSGLFTPALNLPPAHFDCIVFNDVLEHMTAPEAALRLAADLLAPNGLIIASVPNVAHFPTVWRLVAKGDWTYRERGTLDKTHLRFFTRSSIKRLFETEGLKVTYLEGINPFFVMFPDDIRPWKLYRLFRWFPRQSFRDMRFLQFAITASR